MARDIQTRAREVLDSDTARTIAATAVGEVIRRVGATSSQASERVSDFRVSAAGGFAAGAGVATVAQVAARRIGRLISSRKKRTPLFSQPAAKVASGARKTVQAPRDAVDAFTSKLGSGSGSGQSRSSSGTRRSKPTGTASKRAGTSGAKKTSRQAGTRASTAAPGSRTRRSTSAQSKARPSTAASRGSSAKTSRSSNGSGKSSSARTSRSSNPSSATARAKTSRSPNGTSKSPSAKSTRSSNGSRAKSGGGKSAARPAASRRS